MWSKFTYKQLLTKSLLLTIDSVAGSRILIITDSMAGNLGQIREGTVKVMRGANPYSVLEFLQETPGLLNKVEVVLIHVETNYIGGKEEWKLYKNYQNNYISKYQYEKALHHLNPPPASGPAICFVEIFQQIIDFIKAQNENAKVLVSGIIPRIWDFARRRSIVAIYNNLLRKFNDQKSVYFIPTHKPYLNQNSEPKSELFCWDGLHLSDKGSIVLRSFFSSKLDKAKKGVLK